MGIKTKAILADLGTFTRIMTYSGISGMFRNSDILGTLSKPRTFKTLGSSEPEAYA